MAELVNMKEYAKINGVDRGTIWRAVKNGKITPVKKTSSEVLFDPSIPFKHTVYTAQRGKSRDTVLSKYPQKDVDRLRNIFRSMKARCYNPKNPRYSYYGGKGIRICDEWLEDRIRFIVWSFENGYANYLTIDRIDSDKNYCPENCQWITREENSRKAGLSGRKKHVNSVTTEWREKQRTSMLYYFNKLLKQGKYTVDDLIDDAIDLDFEYNEKIGKFKKLAV